jgi:hypothetical protein
MIIRNKFFVWVKKLTEDSNILSLNDFILKYGTPEMMELHNILENQLFGNDKIKSEFPPDEFAQELKKARNNYLSESKTIVERTNFRMRLNP